VLLFGIVLAILSGVANGLFTTPMKLIPGWKWENIWLIFILIACWAMPLAMVAVPVSDLPATLAALPAPAVQAALLFGFGWGFGCILFGLSVDRLGVSLANSLVLGLSSALGSFVPLIVSGNFRPEPRLFVLMTGVVAFIVGVGLCARAGRLREAGAPVKPSVAGYLFALGSGVMSAVFNIGYTLALPIASSGQKMGLSSFTSTNLIWLLMLGAGAIPNIGFCLKLMVSNRSFPLFKGGPAGRTWGYAALMGLLWGGSIFLYGAATPLLGDIGPAIGWPLSLAVGLLLANAMGLWLGEWRQAPRQSVRFMRFGIGALLVAIIVCSISSKL
jgi:L-rhamnose-H+ transport protein